MIVTVMQWTMFLLGDTHHRHFPQATHKIKIKCALHKDILCSDSMALETLELIVTGVIKANDSALRCKGIGEASYK
jgi:hypothetical protein